MKGLLTKVFRFFTKVISTSALPTLKLTFRSSHARKSVDVLSKLRLLERPCILPAYSHFDQRPSACGDGLQRILGEYEKP